MEKRRVRAAVHSQAAHIVARLLTSDAKQSGGASIKSLTLAEGVRAKSATHAVVCETLKHVRLLEELAAEAGLFGRPAKRRRVEPSMLSARDESSALTCVLVYELLLGSGCGAEESEVAAAVCSAEASLRAGLASRLAAAGASDARQLLPASVLAASDALARHPRCVRVNTLCCSLPDALAQLRASLPGVSAEVDALLPDCLTLPPGTDLHAHPLVSTGRLVLQGRGSCMAAHALSPAAGWTVVDCCAAPGNKTTHLAALMGNRGRVHGCDASAERLQRLVGNARAAGASCIAPRCCDFLSLDPAAPPLSRADAILLDPSCSGSGTGLSRGDSMLPSGADAAAEAGGARVAALSRFQLAALRHALRSPRAQRLVYSTCSVHAAENEGVVARALPVAKGLGWRLEKALPGWHRRGAAQEGLTQAEAGCLLRTDPLLDGCDGFFLALFVRDVAQESAGERQPARRVQAQAKDVRWAGGGKRAQGGGGGQRRKPLFV